VSGVAAGGGGVVVAGGVVVVPLSPPAESPVPWPSVLSVALSSVAPPVWSVVVADSSVVVSGAAVVW
jgi:hypothetical protein